MGRKAVSKTTVLYSEPFEIDMVLAMGDTLCLFNNGDTIESIGSAIILISNFEKAFNEPFNVDKVEICEADNGATVALYCDDELVFESGILEPLIHRTDGEYEPVIGE